MGNRGLAGKWSHYEESLRVPLIVSDPRVEKSQQGQVTDAIALNLDLPATFVDWAGQQVPQRYQGHSLRPVVEKGKPTIGEVNRFTNTLPFATAFPHLKDCETRTSNTSATSITAITNSCTT